MQIYAFNCSVSKSINAKKVLATEIDIANLTTGVYTINVTISESYEISKIIKKYFLILE